MSPKSIDPVTQLVPGEWDRWITLITDIWVDANPSIRVFIVSGRRNLTARSGPFVNSLLTHSEKRYKYLLRLYLFFVPDVPIVMELSDGGKEYGEAGWHLQSQWNFIG